MTSNTWRELLQRKNRKHKYALAYKSKHVLVHSVAYNLSFREIKSCSHCYSPESNPRLREGNPWREKKVLTYTALSHAPLDLDNFQGTHMWNGRNEIGKLGRACMQQAHPDCYCCCWKEHYEIVIIFGLFPFSVTHRLYCGAHSVAS